MSGLDTLDRAIVRATQAGLPLDPEPYHRVAEQVGATPAQVIERLQAMLAGGVVRRIGAVPNHYALGYLANGMTVWDVVDDWMDEAGRLLAALDYVTHCYHRPRHPPDWPYNLFAMVHAKDRETVAAKVAEMARVLGPMARGHEVLYSTRILKKTGLRIGD
ncbi:MAG: Lrp/AsnC family transcriptional regulator [Rhodospirillales bacterium]|nr:Lrp/AsnC family transcriptional regulator [Rhodospirillales bacterium]